MGSLAEKHIVVTGASAGIGAELCRQLGARRARVVLAARRMQRLEEVASEVRRRGGEALCVECDVSRRSEIDKLAQAARERFGEIDVWVSNAGRGMRHRILEATDSDMLELFTLNCLSSLYAYQAVVPQWLAREDRGSGRQIIDICTLGGKAGFAYNAGYSAAKHAMSAIADVLRFELNGSGIHVTTVYPGRTESEFGDAAIDRSGGDDRVQTTTVARRGNWLARKVVSIQPTEVCARAIVRAMERPSVRVYPHRWGNLAVLVYNFMPRVALKLAGKPMARKAVS
jgi:short-subunit dehydrogenase